MVMLLLLKLLMSTQCMVICTRTGFHTGFLAGGGRNTDSTCVGMHEMMFTRKHYTDILDNNILLP